MPLKRGKAPEIIGGNIKELLRAGHPLKQAQAIAISHAHKMADGGVVGEDEDDLDQDRERNIAEMNIQSQPSHVSNPEEEDLSMHLAKTLSRASEDAEYMADGGMVGDSLEDTAIPPPPDDAKRAENSMRKAFGMKGYADGGLVEHGDDVMPTESAITSVSKKAPMPHGDMLSEEAKKAIAAKKMKRRYSGAAC